GARLDFPNARPAEPVAAAAPAPPPAAKPPADPAPPATAPAASPADGGPKPPFVARGKTPDEPPARHPFHPGTRKANPAPDLLARGDRAYGEKQYREAGRCYEQAHAADPDSVAGRRDEWAYCKLFAVKEQFATADAPALERLEAEVRAAIALSPKV